MHEADSYTPETVPQALGRLRVALDDAYQRAGRELGLTSQQAELLCAAMRPMPVGDLAQVLRCDRSNVSRLVDRAATRGLIARRQGEHDGRVAVIELTADGQRAAEQFTAVLEAQTESLLNCWPAQRQRQTVKLINEISDALEARRPQRLGAKRKGRQKTGDPR